VRVRVGGTEVELPWRSRDALLTEIGHLESSRAIVDAFHTVGTTRPVDLNSEQLGDLLDLLNRWWHRVKTDELPPRIDDLRVAIAEALKV
jgi:hypothetical protein